MKAIKDIDRRILDPKFHQSIGERFERLIRELAGTASISTLNIINFDNSAWNSLRSAPLRRIGDKFEIH